MRVLTVGNMYPPHYLGGYELLWRAAVAYLREAGHQVRVLTTDFRLELPDAGQSDPEPEVHRELRWYWQDHDWPRLPLRERWRLERHNLRTFEDHVERFEPEAVAWWAMGGLSMSLLERARELGLPAAGVIGDEWPLYGPREDQWQRAARRLGPLRRLLRPLVGVSSRLRFERDVEWLLISETLAGRARSAGWSLRRHTVAHPGVARTLFPPSPPRPWRGQLLYAGRIDPRKGIETAIDALPAIPGASLTIDGRGDDAHLGELRTRVESLGVASRVGFAHTPRERLAESYGDADVVLFPVTWDEPFGLVPLEAMAVGRPVVATGTGGSGEYLRDDENCLLFTPGDATALASCVQRLAADDALRERLCAGGFATAQRLTERAFNEEVEAALNRALT